MKAMRLLFIFIFFFITHANGSEMEKPRLSPGIKQLIEDIQGKRPEEVRNLILSRFGPATYNIGSGLLIEIWDVENGSLSFDSFGGPTFVNDDGFFRLIRTKNRVLDNITESFEMLSFADQDPKTNGNRYNLGSLYLDKSGSYKYVDGQYFDIVKDLPAHFFLFNSSGHYSIKFSKGISEEMLLEDIADNTIICQIEFTSSGDKKQTFEIVSRKNMRTLSFNNKHLVFELRRGWSNSWNYE